MAIRAQFTAPLQIVTTQAMRDAVKKKADAEHVSIAAVLRRLIALGLVAERAADKWGR